GFVGKKIKLPLIDREIPIVADEHVDPAFGTGAVKVTPAHDPNDFEIWQRHLKELEYPPQVIGYDGKITILGQGKTKSYVGLSREKARERVVEDLESSARLVKVEDHRHAVGTCYRCGSVVEPLLSDQWFVRMEALAKPALEALDKGDFRIEPESWAKPYSE